jgi:CRP-like cAMP-binding protein
MVQSESRRIDFRIFKEVNSHEASYPAGTEILTPGTVNRVMYIVGSGIVSVQIDNVVVEEVSAGSIFGEMGIVDPRPHSARVVALTNVTLFAVTESQFLQLIRSTPTFALRVMRVLAQRTRAMNERLRKLSAQGTEATFAETAPDDATPCAPYESVISEELMY